MASLRYQIWKIHSYLRDFWNSDAGECKKRNDALRKRAINCATTNGGSSNALKTQRLCLNQRGMIIVWISPKHPITMIVIGWLRQIFRIQGFSGLYILVDWKLPSQNHRHIYWNFIKPHLPSLGWQPDRKMENWMALNPLWLDMQNFKKCGIIRVKSKITTEGTFFNFGYHGLSM